MKEYENLEEQWRAYELENLKKRLERERGDLKEMAKAHLSLIYLISLLLEDMLMVAGLLKPSLLLLACPPTIFLISIGFVHFYFKKEVEK